MATYSWKSAASGSWSTAADWDPAGGPQTVLSSFGPYSEDTALLATGSKRQYEMTGHGIAQTLDVSGDRVLFSNFLLDDIAAGASFAVDNHARVTIAEDSEIILTNHDQFGSGSLTIDNATLTMKGLLESFQGAVSDHGHLIMSGAKANIEFMNVYSGLTIDETSTLSVVDGATFTTAGDKIAGDVIVKGNSSHLTFAGQYGESSSTYSGSGRVSHGGTLDLDELDGKVRLSGGTLGVASVADGAVVRGHGTISGAVDNSGKIRAEGGLLTIEGEATGTGSLAIASGAKLELDATTSETITFSGRHATLQLAANVGATGFLGGFQPGNSIDIAGAKITSVDLSHSGKETILSAFQGTSLIDSFTIGGHIPRGGIHLSDDSSGGTLLTYAPDHHGSGYAGALSWLERAFFGGHHLVG